jgi:Leucine-rich repeat (LRR) protein
MGSFWKKLFGTDAERRIQAAHRSGTLEFYLSRLGLRQLPPSIGQLTQPQELYVTSNQLTALPESLGQLTQLQKLDVSGNQLTALPETLKRLDRLQVLYLHDNPRLGLPPEVLGPVLHEIIFKGGATC